MTTAKTLGAAATPCIHRTYSGTAWTNGRPSVLHCVDCGKAMPLSVLSPLLARETELAEARAELAIVLEENTKLRGLFISRKLGVRKTHWTLARTDTQEEKK